MDFNKSSYNDISFLEHFILMMNKHSVVLEKGKIYEFIDHAVNIEGEYYLDEMKKDVYNILQFGLSKKGIHQDDIEFIKKVILNYFN